MTDVLVGLHVVHDSLLVVEGAVGLGQGVALAQGNAKARSLDDGGRGSDEGKSHRDEGRFAEHRGESGGAGRADPVGGGEQENLMTSPAALGTA